MLYPRQQYLAPRPGVQPGLLLPRGAALGGLGIQTPKGAAARSIMTADAGAQLRATPLGANRPVVQQPAIGRPTAGVPPRTALGGAALGGIPERGQVPPPPTPQTANLPPGPAAFEAKTAPSKSSVDWSPFEQKMLNVLNRANAPVTAEPVDPAMSQLMAGLAVTSAASRPGSTGLGAIAEGLGTGLVDFRNQQNRADKVAMQKRADQREQARLDLEMLRFTAARQDAEGKGYALQTREDGTVWRVNPRSGQMEPLKDVDGRPFIAPRKNAAGFTLAPGQTRYDAQGRPIASRDDITPLTMPQRRENAEIDKARETLSRLKLNRDDIVRRMSKTTDTGRENLDYDPNISALVRQATKRKYGEDDPDYSGVYDRVHGSEAPPVPQPQPQPAPPGRPGAGARLAPGPTNEAAGLLDQARDALRRGADPGAVSQWLRDLGVDPGAL